MRRRRSVFAKATADKSHGSSSRLRDESPSSLRRGRLRNRDAEVILDANDATLLDIVDNVLNKGVVLSGDVTIALAQVDLVYARLSLLLCAADRVLPNEDTDLVERHHQRRQRQARRLSR